MHGRYRRAGYNGGNDNNTDDYSYSSDGSMMIKDNSVNGKACVTVRVIVMMIDHLELTLNNFGILESLSLHIIIQP